MEKKNGAGTSVGGTRSGAADASSFQLSNDIISQFIMDASAEEVPSVRLGLEGIRFASKEEFKLYAGTEFHVSKIRKVINEGKKPYYVSTGSEEDLVCTDPQCHCLIKGRLSKLKTCVSNPWYIQENSITDHYTLDAEGEKYKCTGDSEKKRSRKKQSTSASSSSSSSSASSASSSIMQPSLMMPSLQQLQRGASSSPSGDSGKKSSKKRKRR